MHKEKEYGEEEEKQEKEEKEKEAFVAEEQVEIVMIKLAEERQQTLIGSVGEKIGGQGAEEKPAQGKLCDLAAMPATWQGELKLRGCCGEGRQGGTSFENLGVVDTQQESCPLQESTQVETPHLSPSHQGSSPAIEQPHTIQPRRSTSHEEIGGVTVVEVHNEDNDNGETKEHGATGDTAEENGESSSSGTIQKSYWSRHFLVDLLAVAIPVVPTVAWLCRGPVREGQPMYHIGSLLRGCCTVALHSLRRGGGLRHYPAGGGDLGGSQI